MVNGGGTIWIKAKKRMLAAREPIMCHLYQPNTHSKSLFLSRSISISPFISVFIYLSWLNIHFRLHFVFLIQRINIKAYSKSFSPICFMYRIVQMESTNYLLIKAISKYHYLFPSSNDGKLWQ